MSQSRNQRIQDDVVLEVEPMENGRIRPYGLKAGEGWTYNYGIDFTVKAGEVANGRRLAFVE